MPALGPTRTQQSSQGQAVVSRGLDWMTSRALQLQHHGSDSWVLPCVFRRCYSNGALLGDSSGSPADSLPTLCLAANLRRSVGDLGSWRMSPFRVGPNEAASAAVAVAPGGAPPRRHSPAGPTAGGRGRLRGAPLPPPTPGAPPPRPRPRAAWRGRLRRGAPRRLEARGPARGRWTEWEGRAGSGAAASAARPPPPSRREASGARSRDDARASAEGSPLSR